MAIPSARPRKIMVLPSILESSDTAPIADEPTFATATPAPVSYTHLDVYKRQALRRLICRTRLPLKVSVVRRFNVAFGCGTWKVPLLG